MPYTAPYFHRLGSILASFDGNLVNSLAQEVKNAWAENRSVWICGNGGSAANAVHWANDFLYPVAKQGPSGVKFHALSANTSVLTCLGNDIGYDQVFSRQLTTFASPGDLLIVLSGSGNSPNILEALKAARSIGMKSFAIVGFDGGHAKTAADETIHVQTDDMQIAEDMQMAICHSLVQTLAANKDSN
jgi:D-sedoheptulose 7-phosphate isomerase